MGAHSKSKFYATEGLEFIPSSDDYKVPCRDDPELFFGGVSEQMHAKEICNICRLITECREASIKNEEPAGVWGGLDEKERKALTSKKIGKTANNSSSVL